jgi:hypothetical protein
MAGGYFCLTKYKSMTDYDEDIRLDDIENENLKLVLNVATEYKVFPSHYTTSIPYSNTNNCSCGNPYCKEIGAHENYPGAMNDATDNEDQIKYWWDEDPNLNIGIKAGRESYYMIEIKKGYEDQLTLPPTYTESTETGTKYYYDSDWRHNSFELDGIKFTGDGGCLAVSNWYHNQTEIKELPEELISLLAVKSSNKKQSQTKEVNSAAKEPALLENQDSEPEDLVPDDTTPEVDFFNEKNNQIDGLKLMQYIGKLGVAKVVDEENTSYVYIKNNIVETISIDQIQDILTKQFKDDENIHSALHDKIDTLFSKRKLRDIPTRSVTTLRDTLAKAYLPFKNGLLVITKDGHELIKYKDVDMLIWKHQVIDRNWKDATGGDFEQYIKNISSYREGGQYHFSKSEYEKKLNTIGYLLHTYKDPAESKSVILTDASLLLEDHNLGHVNGQTGKSLFCDAISRMRNLLSYDGKLISVGGDKFAFQNIKLDHQLILFDDVAKGFKFENLFHMITGNMTVEGKNKTKFSIPFKEAPKLVITTNYPFQGDGESYLGRQHIVEFSDFYSTKNKPIDVHGKRFFDDWNGTEWAAFDTFMAGCLQKYLIVGKLNSTRSRNYELKKIDNPEFILFAKTLPLNTSYDRIDLHGLFQKEYLEKMTPNQFYKLLRLYSVAMEYDCIENKSKNRQRITLVQKKKN